ncbi:hypothetical protein AVEN_124737-1, partial [Araneus ventricosus]
CRGLIDKRLLKLWYFAIIEEAPLYGTGDWGGALNFANIKRLHNIQRVFVLKFTRAYRTTSAQVLNVLTGIPPLHLTARSDYQNSSLGLSFYRGRWGAGRVPKFQVWTCRYTEAGEALEVGELDYNENSANIPLCRSTKIPGLDLSFYRGR